MSDVLCPTCPSHHVYRPGILHDYQEIARDFLRGRGRAALWLDMGLGKTASTLAALEDRHLLALVVAPKKVAENVWDAEQARWRPDLSIGVAAGSADVRASVLLAQQDITVISRDNLGDVNTVLRRLPYRTLILDELSSFRSRGARWREARRITRRASIQYVWGLTGTPAPNGYLDLFYPIQLLDNGAHFGTTIGGYRDRYFNPGRRIANGTIVEWNLKPGAEQRIQEKLSDIVLAMATEGRIKLPPITFNTVGVELPARARRAYNEMKEELVHDFTDILGGEVVTSDNAAILTQKLSQLTSGFIYQNDRDIRPDANAAYTVVHHEKPNALAEIMEADRVGGVLVAYNYVPERNMLLAKFDGKAGRPKARCIDEPGVLKEWDRGNVDMLIAHPASAGHGLNLQHGGHTLVWHSPTWDLELWDQFNKRLARQGQKHPVVVHVIAANYTIDGTVLRSVKEKKTVQDDLLAALESPI